MKRNVRFYLNKTRNPRTNTHKETLIRLPSERHGYDGANEEISGKKTRTAIKEKLEDIDKDGR